MITLYGMSSSGNCYKLQLLMAQLGREYEWEEIDVTRGENLSPEFLALNDRGKVPVLRLDDGRTLSESNAILNYLAQGTRLLPDDPWGRAKTLQWMFFEQYSHEPNIATSRFWLHHVELTDEKKALLQEKNRLGYAALDVMEQHLTARSFFVGERYTIADIALFAYTHIAEDGGFDLGAYPHVERWIKRVQMQPGFVPMRDTAPD